MTITAGVSALRSLLRPDRRSAAPPTDVAPARFADFGGYFAHYERRFRELAITRAPNGPELKLIRAGWDDPAVRSLLDDVVAGKLSATAAAVRLGWAERRTALDELRSAWARAGEGHKRAFVAEFADELRTLAAEDQGDVG